MIASTILSILSAVINIYTILCIIDIFLSWFPGAKKSTFGKFISQICDPYLNLFSKIKFLKVGNIDFSPVISIGLLSLVSSILAGLTRTGRIFIGAILGTIVQMVWSLLSFMIGIFGLLAFIRWIVLISSKNSGSSSWDQLDTLLSKIAYKIVKPFSKGVVAYKNALLFTWILAIIIIIVGYIVFGILTGLCYKMPF